MKILILDDDPSRHRLFGKRLPSIPELQEVIHVTSYDGIIAALLAHSPFDLIYLDHDLNDYGKNSVMAGMYGNVELTGYDVARYIAEMSDERKPKKVIVHSWNPPGAQRMLHCLQGAFIPCSYEPFEGKR